MEVGGNDENNSKKVYIAYMGLLYESVSKMNYLKKGSLEFTKTDLSTDEPLPNTLIEVYTENDANNVGQVQLRHDVVLVGTLKTEKWMVQRKESKGG